MIALALNVRFAAARLLALVVTRDYSSRVRRDSLNRWAVVILLVTRLVLGELAHAHEGAHASASVAQESSQCHDDTKPTDKSDCCKTGACECPCLFGAAVVSGVTFSIAHTTEIRAAAGAIGATLDRPFTLFRPPASLR